MQYNSTFYITVYFSLLELLKRENQWQLLEKAATSSILHDTERGLLANTIVRHVIAQLPDFHQRVTRDILQGWAKDVVAVFPFEKEAAWYHPKITTSCKI